MAFSLTHSAELGSDTREELGGSKGVLVEESTVVNKPIGEVYRFWRDLEKLPTFMQHLENVAQREAGVWHWVAKGPLGMHVEWDARIINDVADKVIGWQSLDDSQVSTAGSVNFDQMPSGTRVKVRLQYNPPAGKLGAAVAKLLGEDPAKQVREDLQRFKVVMETA